MPEPIELSGEALSDERRRFSRLGMALCAMFAVTIALQYALLKLMVAFAPQLIEAEWTTWVISLAPMYLVGAPIAIALLLRVPAAAPVKRKLPAGELFALFCMAVFLVYSGAFIGSVVRSWVGSIISKEVYDPVSEMISGLSLMYTAVFTVLVAPVVEELIFRRLLMDRTLHCGQLPSVLLSALLFGLYHGNLAQFFYAFLIGALLATVYAKTGRLRYTIGLHMAVNLMGSVMAPLLMSLSGDAADPAAGALTVVYSVAILAMGIAGLVLLIRRLSRLRFEAGAVTLGRHAGRVIFVNSGMLLLFVACGVMFAMNTFL